MNRNCNYILVDNPNGRPTSTGDIPFAELINIPDPLSSTFDADIAKVEAQDMYLPHYSVRVSKGVFTQDA